MKKNKRFILTLTVILIVIMIGSFSPSRSLLLFMSDSYFTLSAVLLIIGLFGLILKDGTFDFFHYSMKKARNRIFNREKTEQANRSELPDEEDLHHLSRSISNTYKSFLKIGSLFLILSVISLLIDYLLK